MTRTAYCLTILLLFTLNALSQKKVDPTPEEISKAELLKEQFPDDQVVLLESTDYVSFDFSRKDNKVSVIHDMTKTMMNIDSRADIQNYCFYDGESKVEEFIIRYKNNRNAKFYIKDEAYTSNDLFHNDTRVKYVNLDFPIKGYQYISSLKKHYNDIKYFTKLYFNDDYPTLKKSITIDVPNWLNLELKEINFEGFSIEKSETPNSQGDGTIYTYTLNDVPAMYDEEMSPGPTYIYPHLLILAKSHTFNGKNETIFDSTQDLYNWYKSLVNSLENDTTKLLKKVNELTENAKTDEEKIKNIYYWVQDNIRYIAFEDGIAGFKPDEATNVFTKRYGDCKGMANLTKLMLVEAGFDARLTWIGTKHIAYDYSTPNLSVDNHMICALIKDDETIFLDGTEKFNAFGEYADRIQGKQALIENGDAFILKEVPSINADFNKELFNYELVLDGEIITGKVNKIYAGESRSNLLYHFNTLKSDNKDTFLEWYLNKGNSNIKVDNIVTSDLSNRDINLNLSYDITLKNMASSFDNTIYIDLDFDKELSNHNFDERKTDFIFNSKKSLESTTSLQIPSGYTITHVPKNIDISTPNYDLKVQFKKENNKVIYKKNFKIKNAKIETSDFKEWNSFIKDLNNVYNEQIILTKQ